MTSPPKGWAGFGALQEVKRQREERAREQQDAQPVVEEKPVEISRSRNDRQSPDDRQSPNDRQSSDAMARNDRQSPRPAPASRGDRQPRNDRQSARDRQSPNDRQSAGDRQPLRDSLKLEREFCTLFNSIYDEVLPTLAPPAQSVYIQLCRLSYGNKRNYCQIGHPRLAERSNLGLTATKAAVKQLERRGLVTVVDYKFSGESRGTTYYIPLPPGTPEDAVRQSSSDRQSPDDRQSRNDRQSPRDPMKDLEKHDENAVYEIRTIAARLFEAHRSDPGFDRDKLRALVRDALIAHGISAEGDVVDEAIKGMAP